VWWFVRELSLHGRFGWKFPGTHDWITGLRKFELEIWGIGYGTNWIFPVELGAMAKKLIERACRPLDYGFYGSDGLPTSEVFTKRDDIPRLTALRTG
jgi:hypothetical protein